MVDQLHTQNVNLFSINEAKFLLFLFDRKIDFELGSLYERESKLLARRLISPGDLGPKINSKKKVELITQTFFFCCEKKLFLS